MSQPYGLDTALRFLERGLEHGQLTLTEPDGRTRVFGGRSPGPPADMTIRDWRVLRAVLMKGDIGLGESYMAGWWDSSDLVALSSILVRNTGKLGKLAWGSPWFQFAATLRHRLLRRNSIQGSRSNILAHYDLGNNFYKLWLDPSLSYSSALYASGSRDLASAQHSKYTRILERIGTRSQKILEIGCGWGGFIETACAHDHHVTGLTISDAQFQVAKTRAPAASEVRLQDYRQASGRFDAVVSIEMFEAVGERYWPIYFRALAERLNHKGVAVVQTITIADDLFPAYRTSSDYIRHHIFPGGMLPSLLRFRQEAQKAGLVCRDVFSFGTDYARTLLDWLERFDAAATDIRALGYDEAFMRGWRFYLALCAGAFLAGRTDVHQIELAVS